MRPLSRVAHDSKGDHKISRNPWKEDSPCRAGLHWRHVAQSTPAPLQRSRPPQHKESQYSQTDLVFRDLHRSPGGFEWS